MGMWTPHVDWDLKRRNGFASKRLRDEIPKGSNICGVWRPRASNPSIAVVAERRSSSLRSRDVFLIPLVNRQEKKFEVFRRKFGAIWSRIMHRRRRRRKSTVIFLPPPEGPTQEEVQHHDSQQKFVVDE